MSSISAAAQGAPARRTFAIISHPDAGKTTLTEKLLLFGGAIQLAGAVKGRKAARHATSDWMALERERGISVTTSVMQFPYGGCVLNLLDTPGHEDFSEDTYRTLTAVDSALMVIDAAKGVEPRTEKLMEVCRLRDTPIVTFVNKLDREGRAPLDLLDEIERVLRLKCAPVTWPLGMGRELAGVYHLLEDRFYLYSGDKARVSAIETVDGLAHPSLEARYGPVYRQAREEIELLRAAGEGFDLDAYRAARVTPVFFGAAITNFGVRELLEGFVRWAPPPQPRAADARVVAPDEPAFTAFCFKIQANMDPRHRDRVAFLRVCSGEWRPGKTLHSVRLGGPVRVGQVLTFMAAGREAVEHAVAGDIVGVHNHGTIAIGDTFTEGEALRFGGVPSFAPEIFRRVVLRDPMKSKQLGKGLDQLCEEGATQVYRPLDGNDTVLGAVGPLQLDVVQARLREEYGVNASFEPVGLYAARWFEADDARALAEFRERNRARIARDHYGAEVYLAPNKANLELLPRHFPAIRLSATREPGAAG
jgi:peptide chain release factor 3